ncbi:DUF6234 family protein [Streptomyces sp. NPDC048643]|uniref:DUF6234 family protein n=1 Tax=Streptomyces sp. NPDC048643 TaxID=3155637 RepID=UPI0034494545
MTTSLPVRNQWRPWSSRTRRGVDLAFALPLFVMGTAWLALDWMFGHGLEIWATQGDQVQADAATLAHIHRVWVLLVAVLVLAVLAGLFRAPWAVGASLLLALLAVQVLMVIQYQWDTGHVTAPACVPFSANC